MHMVVECIIGLCIDLKSLKNTLESIYNVSPVTNFQIAHYSLKSLANSNARNIGLQFPFLF